MKKFFKYLFSFLLAIPMVFALTACGPTPPGDDEKNPEFAQFKTMAQSIIAQYQVDQSGGQELMLAARNSESVDSLIKTNGSKVDTVNSYYAGFLNIAFYTPLAVGDVITNQSGATKFYGLTVKITDGFDGYLQVAKNGTHTFIYAFDSVEDSNRITYVDVNYTSIENYEINGYVASTDNSYFSYIYLDSDFNFKSVEKSDDSYAVTSNGVSHYKTEDVNAISQISGLVVSSNDLENYKTIASSIANSSQYSITKEKMEEVLSNYLSFEPTEGDYALAHGYVVRSGVVENVNLEGQNFHLKTIVLPRTESVDSIWYNLQLPSCVERVIIPSNIKKVKFSLSDYYLYLVNKGEMQRSEYDAYVAQKNAEWANNQSSYVYEYAEVPAEKLLSDFYLGRTNRILMDKDIEFIFEEGSTLFKKEGNNSYIKIGEDWKIFQLVDDAVFGEETVELNNNGIKIDNVTKNVEHYFSMNGYPVFKNIILTNTFTDLVKAYPNSNDNIELDILTLKGMAYDQAAVLSYMNSYNYGFGVKKVKKLIINNCISNCDLGSKDNQLVQINDLEISGASTIRNIKGYIKGNLNISSEVYSFVSDNSFEIEGNLTINLCRDFYFEGISGISCGGTCTINIPISQNESSYSFDASGINASQGIETNYVENLEFDLTGKLSLSGTELTYIAEESETSLNFTNLITETNGFNYKVCILDEGSFVEIDANNIDLTELAKATLEVVATNSNGLSLIYKMFIIIE